MLQLLSVFSGSTDCARSDTDIVRGSVRECVVACLLSKTVLMIRIMTRMKYSKVKAQQGQDNLSMGLNMLGKHVMMDLVECKQAAVHTSSSFHLHLMLSVP